MSNGIAQNLNSVANGTTTNSSTYSNPKSTLGQDAFLKLLLTEMQYQDPTKPMDSGKILTQTSQLATLESANNTNKTMKDLAAKLNNNMDMGALSAIGKMASLGNNHITLPKSNDAQFEIYFKNKIQNGTIAIKDTKGNTIKTVPLDSQTGKSGILSFTWDGKDSSGNRVAKGLYSVSVSYTDASGNQLKTQPGIYPVESVKYTNGKPYMKLGSSYVDMKKIVEFY